MSTQNKKPRKWIVTSAWPYVNAIPHLGNLIGSVLSSDVFARYVRLKGDECVFVSGSDEHGTPVAVSAITEKMTPEELTRRNHARIKQLFEEWQISFDNYTHTHNPTHIKFVQDFYREIEKNGYVFTKEEEAFYCEHDKLFLPDRFIEGNCPYCGSEYARGDQCDQCGKLLTPEELINPRCKICGKTPIKKNTTHWYMDFSKTEDEVRKFIENNSLIPQNARTASLNFLKEGLPSRAITRDLKWGIPAPFKGAEDKTIYVWFEAVLGYISAVKEWAEKIINDPSRFSYFWNDPESRAVYFIGKDNIIFHLIIFPGLLVAYNKDKKEGEKFVLPYNVSSTEFLMYESDKFSKSRKIGIWIDEALQLAPVEYWRYTLLRNRPEKSDSSFLWSQFEHDILELNDVFGNFVHRVLTFIYKHYEGKVPKAPPAEEWDDLDKDLMKTLCEAPKKIEDLIERFRLKEALNEIVSFARKGNIYLNDKAPWKVIKKEKEKAGYAFYFSIQMIRSLAILLSPYIPNIGEKIFELINEKGSIENGIWDTAGEMLVEEGRSIPKPVPLFKKLDIKEMKKKLAELHGGEPVKEKPQAKPQITYDEFQKLDLRVATILDAEYLPDARNLVKLIVDVGENETRTLVAGIAKNYKPDELVGTQIVIIANLEPKEIHGVKSNGMLLAADMKKKGAALLRVDYSVPNGSRVR